ncbi:MAG: Tad domain-containing protein, partial [Rhodobacteraceae bacterium]|nr:Tad domain-containing protein [Paracoccaceae bacterium]
MNRFAKDDNGTILVLSIYFFLLIVMFAGIGVDMIMFERDRSRLQSTSDRASLAAADLDQTLDPEAVVEDYFAKEGLSDYLISVNVDEGLNYRTVSVVASSDVQTNFMHMTGVESLTAVAGSTAEERIDGVEISMVLDVSGS